ncbi:MAG: hypothetical protein ACLQKK_09790 [Rhodomicrobium sp.]
MNRSARTVRPLGIKIIGTLTIVFGMLEVQAAFRHEFAGIVTADKSVFTYAAAIVGLFYIASGILVLSMRKWAAGVAIMLLLFDVIGRIGFVVSGLYPTNTLKQTLAIAIGTAIAAIFAIYIAAKWNAFK